MHCQWVEVQDAGYVQQREITQWRVVIEHLEATGERCGSRHVDRGDPLTRDRECQGSLLLRFKAPEGDCRIVPVDRQFPLPPYAEHQIAVTLTDKSPDAPGQITVYLARGETPELAGWVTTDMQGGVTKVEVSDLSRPDSLKKELFERRKLFMKSIQ